jgi:hypothetical protein
MILHGGRDRLHIRSLLAMPQRGSIERRFSERFPSVRRRPESPS